MDFDAFRLGQTVELNDGRTAIVRFLGQGAFAPGDWIGVELNDATGKNDGSVQGERYFDCNPGHGMFLRTVGIQSILEEPTPKPKPKPKPDPVMRSGPVGASKTRPVSAVIANGTRRQSVMDPTAAKRQSINAASPTPSAAARRQTILNGSKTGSKPMSSTATSSAASSRGVTPNPRKPAIRPTIAGKSSGTTSPSKPPIPTTITARTRSSIAPPVNTQRSASATSRAAAGPSSRLSPGVTSRTSGASSVQSRLRTEQNSQTSLYSQPEATPSEADETESDAAHSQAESELEKVDKAKSEDGAEEPKDTPQPLPSQSMAKVVPEIKTTARPVISRTTAAGRQIEELEAKLRLLERKRNEDQEKLAALDKLRTERDKFEKIIQTLQAKYGPQAQELASLRAKLKQAEDGTERVDAINAEHESMMEMATLDREMAEETAEALKAELEILKEKAVELELEVEVLREENEELGKEMSPEERNSQGWLQMEKSNDRMREALIRLRDVTQAQELEMKEQIAGLEHDLEQLEGIHEQFNTAKEQLARSEAAMENLKQQLDAALNAEEMVEDLTEANNNLSDEISKLRIEVEELQTINELNDEFEQQHLENEKQMQEEIDARGAALAERIASAAKQEEKMNDYEYTLAKFRELVNNLQTHLADMRASQQLTEAEAEDLNNRSKAMTDLNLKLQSSAARTQSNTIDLEIRRLEAQQALEHLDIIQLFLPEGFKAERTSVLVYLRFKRVAFKAYLLYGFLKDRVTNFSAHSESDRIFIYCDVMDKLAWIAAMCERFVGDISRCSIDRFGRYEGSLQELEPVERGLNGYIEAWKKDELRETVAAEELERSAALLSHLAESLFLEDLPSYVEKVSMRTKLMQSNLETAAAALACSRTVIEAHVARDAESTDDEEEEEEQDGAITGSLNYLETMIGQVRSTKVVAGKAFTAVVELEARKMTFSPYTDELFSDALEATMLLSRRAQSLGTSVMTLSEPSMEDELLGTRIRSVLSTFHTSNYPDMQKPSTPLAGLVTQIKLTSEKVASVAQLTGDVTKAEEFEKLPAPWKLRADTLKATSVNNTVVEQELFRLKEMMQDRLIQLRSRDQTVEEQNVRIELLESRTKDARERSQRIEVLQKDLDQGKKREAELMIALDKSSTETEHLRDERDKYRKIVESRVPVGREEGEERGTKAQNEENAATAFEMDALRLEIRSLQGTVQYLRRDNFETRFADPATAAQMSWLEEPLLKTRAAPASKAREERERLEKQGNQVLDSLIQLVLTSKLVDLQKLPEKKLKWMSESQKSRHLCLVNEQKWAHWKGKKERFTEVRRRQY